MWNSRKEGKVADEYFDLTLEVASYAKKHLEIVKSMEKELPKNTHITLLLAQEAELFLKDLEEFNFDIFDSHFSTKYYMKVPWRMWKAARDGSSLHITI